MPLAGGERSFCEWPSATPELSARLGLHDAEAVYSGRRGELENLEQQNRRLHKKMARLARENQELKQGIGHETQRLIETRRILLDALRHVAHNEERLKQALQTAGVCAWHLDIQRKAIRWSDEIYRLFGLQQHESVTLETIFEYTHPEDRQGLAQAWENALVSGSFCHDYRIVVAGRSRWVCAYARITFSPEHRAVDAHGIIQDVDRLKTQELENSRLLSIQNAILKSDVVGFAIMKERRFVWVNPNIARSWGYQPDELIGQSIRCLYPDDESFQRTGELAYAALASGEVFKSELSFVRKDGGSGCLSVSGTLLDAASQTSLWSYVDITEQKDFQSELLLARQIAEAASRTKSEFLANMSHEIRTPLNAVTGMLHLLRDTPLNEQQRLYLRNIESASTVLLAVINDILDYSKIEAGRLEIHEAPLDLSRIFHTLGVIANAAVKNKDIDVLFNIAPKVPHELIGDALRLEQILINLINNAIKFTQVGHVFVHVELEALAPAEVSLRFDVEDTGIGIPPELQEKLFQPFTQAESSTSRRFGGTGLGLAISHRLAGLMGGTLSLQSEAGLGSTFSLRVRLPRQSSESRPWVVVPEHLRKLRVLLLDSNQRTRDLTLGMLDSLGWHAVVAKTEEENVVRLIRDALFHGKPFDLCLLATHYDAASHPWIRLLHEEIPEDMQPKFIRIANSPDLAPLTSPASSLRIAATLLRPFTPSSLFDTVSPFFVVNREPIASAKHDNYLGQIKVLVAEDNELNQILIRELLARLGIVPYLASDGEECLLQLEGNPESFDLILMDMQMPGIDGLEATRRLRAEPRFSSLPVIALTANAQPRDREACIEAGMNDFLTKPIDPEKLELVLHEYLGARFLELTENRFSVDSADAGDAGQSPVLISPEILDFPQALQRMGNDQLLYREILSAFVRSYRDFFTHIHRLENTEQNLQSASRLTHTARGLAQTIGARKLAVGLETYETMLARGEWYTDAAIDLSQQIEADLKETLTGIESYLHRDYAPEDEG